MLGLLIFPKMINKKIIFYYFWILFRKRILMKPIKIHNEGRVKKQMTRKAELLGQTPPKYT